MDDLRRKLDDYSRKLTSLREKLSYDKWRKEIESLQTESQRLGFWSDATHAQSVMQRIADLTQETNALDDVGATLADARVALELEMHGEAAQKIRDADVKLSRLELATFLSGPHDASDAILGVHSGQGGTEAMDWAEMLQRMYQRYFDRKGWKWELVAYQSGEEAGIKSATLVVHGRYTYGYLKGERGTHRLVRRSPFNADHLRQTSFALVEVMPVLEDDTDIVIKPDDIRFEATRSSGHGGQNVNKVNTAVRLTHIPTGIVVESQSQRYQEQNRKIGMQLLRAKLWEREEKKRQEERRRLKGGQTMASWGTQIRSYVLHPYKLVKDVRTDVESHVPDAVLDGDLDAFIEAELRIQ